MRDTFIYQNNKIRRAGHFRVLKHKKLDGCHQNYLVYLADGRKGYIKATEGCTDYGEVIMKSICDRIGVPCAQSKLISMHNFPNKLGKMLSFEEFTKKSKGMYKNIENREVEKLYKEYEEKYQSLQSINGVLSYDYAENEFKNAKFISLGVLFFVYREITGEDIDDSIEGYLKVIKELACESSETGKYLRKNMCLGNVNISKFLEDDVKKLAILGFLTGQVDMSMRNLNLAVVNDTISLAPIFDNGHCFGLYELAQSSKSENIENILSRVNYPNALRIKKHPRGNSLDSQRLDLAIEIKNNPTLLSFYNKLRNIDIDAICDEHQRGEEQFENVKHLVTKIFKYRRNLLDQEIERQVRLEQVCGATPINKSEETRGIDCINAIQVVESHYAGDDEAETEA